MRYEGGCSTVVIGKAASATGRVLVGHNEDDDISLVQVHSVPRKRHEPGETVSFGDRPDVKIPQAPETLAFYWSEVRRPGGISFGDCFFNECGVAVVTNSCNPGKIPGKTDADKEAFLAAQGLGYGVRRLLGERARSAREGLAIIIELVEKYGYFSGRCYQIADKDECWAVQLTRGKYLVAKRIPDDHVYFMPNHYTIHALEPSDKENFYYTPGIVENAIENGWYRPAVPGDYSDFDFAKAYQTEGERPYNTMRTRNAWPILGFETEWLASEAAGCVRPFSFKAHRKYTIDDCKALLRTHYEGREDSLARADANGGVTYPCDPHQTLDDPYTICCGSTVESTVFDFADDPAACCMYRTWRKPCTNPYVPIFLGQLKALPGYAWMTADEADATHFDPPAEEFQYRPDAVYWNAQNLIWQTELDYGFARGILAPEIERIEKGWDEEVRAARARYEELKAQDAQLAAAYLSSFSEAKAIFASHWLLRMTQTIGDRRYRRNQGLPEE